MTVKKWLENTYDYKAIGAEIREKIRTYTRFIWYEINGDVKPEIIFTNINMGKIKLTNAELIKALLLKKDNYKGESEKEITASQIKISTAWDNMEATLQREDMWRFLTGSGKFSSIDTHMELIFQIMANEIIKSRVEKYPEFYIENEKQLNRETYTFIIFNREIEYMKREYVDVGDYKYSKMLEDFWGKVESFYNMFIDWYEDREWYHLIGVLLSKDENQSEEYFENLCNLYRGHTKTEFVMELKKKIISEIEFEDTDKDDFEFGEEVVREYLNSLQYSGKKAEKNKIKNMLLLFNVISMQQNTDSNPRFPFDAYIISVDIFSEGVDVPEINQVIMLRPTESPIVFIQQLGRGLRKAENKEYVVVLDFIGNYRNNFMIPIALSGDRSYNKDNIRRYVTEGGRVIPGASTIHFDEISRKRIFQAIDNANFSDIKLIRENYTNLKNKLGHIPALADFDKYGEMDVLRIFDNNSLGSYYKFLVKYEKEYTIRLSEDEEKAIEFISKKLASGKRIHELELLKRTLQYHHGIIGRLRKHLSEKYHCEMDEHCMENVINMMTNEFPTSAAKKTYAQCVFLKKEQDDYGISDVYGKMLQNPEFCAILEELVDFGISRYKVNYSYHYQDTNLVLYQKYTYEDACRLLNWERNEVPLNIGGYKYDKKTKTFPIFINYDKQDNISDTTKYEDHFVAENRLIAISKSGRSMDSEDVQNFLNATERGIDVQLFVRKNKDDKISKEFYYLGRVIATGNAKQFVMPNTDKTAVEIEWELETPVREDIYQYIVNE